MCILLHALTIGRNTSREQASHFSSLPALASIITQSGKEHRGEKIVKIDEYTFGKIVVDGHTYTSDVIITPETVIDSWWRKEGHRLDKSDLENILDAKPDCLLVGTGYYGQMKIPQETLQYLQSKNIQIVYAPTQDAISELNQLQKRCARIVAALHLTC